MPAQIQKEFSTLLSKMEAEQEELALLHDGTEREIARPTDSDLQKEKYCGKKKKHTVKNVVVICATCMILFISQTVAGTIHDKKMADKLYDFTVRCTVYSVSGYWLSRIQTSECQYCTAD